jgi:hypothetical protein
MKTNCRKKPLTFVGLITAALAASDGQLAEQYVEPTKPLPSVKNAVETAWRKAIASHVPVGYEDETGFHYGPHPGD